MCIFVIFLGNDIPGISNTYQTRLQDLALLVGTVTKVYWPRVVQPPGGKITVNIHVMTEKLYYL